MYDLVTHIKGNMSQITDFLILLKDTHNEKLIKRVAKNSFGFSLWSERYAAKNEFSHIFKGYSKLKINKTSHKKSFGFGLRDERKKINCKKPFVYLEICCKNIRIIPYIYIIYIYIIMWPGTLLGNMLQITNYPMLLKDILNKKSIKRVVKNTSLLVYEVYGMWQKHISSYFYRIFKIKYK